MDRGKLYNKLIKAYTNTFGYKLNGKQIQLDVSKIWKDMKTKSNVEELVNENILRWKKISIESKSKLLSMWSKVTNDFIINCYIYKLSAVSYTKIYSP